MVLIILASCGGNGTSSSSENSYSNASLTGNWIITEASRSYYMTAVEVTGSGFDEYIREVSRIDLLLYNGFPSVNNDGSFSLQLYEPVNGTGVSGTGKLISPTYGTIIFTQLSSIAGTMSKVTDLTICQGHYSGTISNNGVTNNISFDVDMSGNISNFISDISVMYFSNGKAYAVGNNAAMLMRGSGYSISAWGTLENGHFTGSFQSDPYAIGTISLVKS